MVYFIYYLLAVNFLAFLIMKIDKKKARRHEWRIPEATLFLFAIACGSVGIWSGMYLLRHKTKHMKFVAGIPVIIILQLLASYYLYVNLL